MIVITGASGLIGRALAASALRENKAVRLQGRSVESVAQALYTLNVHADLEVVELDFKNADQPQYDRLMNGSSTVVHSAGLVHKSDAPAAQYDALNFRATQLVANAAKRAKVDTFVFLSTSAVYGNGPFVDIDESAPVQGDTPYAVSKIRCEEWLKENPPAPKTVILRPSLVFGEGDRGNLLSLIKQINKGLYFHIGGNNAKKSLIYAGDVAQAINRCITQLDGGYHVLNVANPRTINVEELSNTIAICLGKAPPPTVPEVIVRAGAMLGGAVLGDKSPLTMQKMTKLMTTTTCSVKRLVSTTGFVPGFPVDEAIGAEIQWARAQGILGPIELKSYR
jgi:nucleoside-diphosphate-sugar epimerase